MFGIQLPIEGVDPSHDASQGVGNADVGSLWLSPPLSTACHGLCCWFLASGSKMIHAHLHTHTHLLRTIIANSDVECILRAKTFQLYLTGMGRLQDLRKYRKGTIAIAIARCNKLEADTYLSTKPNRSHPDRLRKPYRR